MGTGMGGGPIGDAEIGAGGGGIKNPKQGTGQGMKKPKKKVQKSDISENDPNGFQEKPKKKQNTTTVKGKKRPPAKQ